MESQEQEYSYFLGSENNLESVIEAYFNLRSVEDEPEGESCDDFSSDEEGDQDDNIDSDNDLEFEFSEVDKSEHAKVEAFISESCGCTQGDQGKPCSSAIQTEDIIECRNNCFELSSTELDLVILGTIHSSLNCDEVSNSGRTEKKRQRTRMPFYFHNHRICLKTFLFMHRLHKTRFYSLVKHYRNNGLTLRIHGNKKRLPSSALSTETIERECCRRASSAIAWSCSWFQENGCKTSTVFFNKAQVVENLSRCLCYCQPSSRWLFKVL